MSGRRQTCNSDWPVPCKGYLGAREAPPLAALHVAGVSEPD